MTEDRRKWKGAGLEGDGRTRETDGGGEKGREREGGKGEEPGTREGAERAWGEARRAGGSSVQSSGRVLLPPRSPWPGGGGEAASPVYVFF
jgi:hypothetical protein